MSEEYDEVLSPAEYMAHNLFSCWTTELHNIIYHKSQHDHILFNHL
jgi:hypothetical protein